MYYASSLDRQHSIRKRAAHRIIARCLRGDRGADLMRRAHAALDEMERTDGQTPYVRGWRDLFSVDRIEVARRIVRRDEAAEDLRETSPFMQLHGFDYGKRMSIVFSDEEIIRPRMWNLAKRLANIDPRHSEVPACRQPTPF